MKAKYKCNIILTLVSYYNCRIGQSPRNVLSSNKTSWGHLACEIDSILRFLVISPRSARLSDCCLGECYTTVTRLTTPPLCTSPTWGDINIVVGQRTLTLVDTDTTERLVLCLVGWQMQLDFSPATQVLSLVEQKAWLRGIGNYLKLCGLVYLLISER